MIFPLQFIQEYTVHEYTECACVIVAPMFFPFYISCHSDIVYFAFGICSGKMYRIIYMYCRDRQRDDGGRQTEGEVDSEKLGKTETFLNRDDCYRKENRPGPQ